MFFLTDCECFFTGAPLCTFCEPKCFSIRHNFQLFDSNPLRFLSFIRLFIQLIFNEADPLNYTYLVK